MNTRAFKKALSVVCVLALLLSVCVVALAGVSSAVETSYHLHTSGIVETVALEEGDDLPTPTIRTIGVRFEGWYDSTFTTKYEKAGTETELYAKLSSYVYNFDGVNEGGVYRGKDNYTGASRFTVGNDPKDPATSNKNQVIYRAQNDSANPNFAFETYPGSNVPLTLEAGVKYEFRFRYMSQNATNNGMVQIRMSTKDGIGDNGGKSSCILDLPAGAYELIITPSANWTYVATTFTVPQSAINAGQIYPIFLEQGGSSANGTYYFDDLTITKVEEKTYTFNNNGEITSGTYTAGDALPPVRGYTFKGWYDKTLTQKYTTVPATDTELVAYFDTLTRDFETPDQIWNPNNSKQASIVEDPLDPSNHVVRMNIINGRYNFAPLGAVGADAGVHFERGKVYIVTFKYYINGSNTGAFDMRATDKRGVGGAGYKSNGFGNKNLSGNGEWQTCQEEIVINYDADMYPNLLLTIYNYQYSTGNEKFYVDDFSIRPKETAVSTEDMVMDFETDDGSDFRWSVEGANNYTVNSGNGYVTRGELVTEGDNHLFRVKHFSAINTRQYFTVNDGTEQFSMTNGGVYRIDFDYKVEHSETPLAIELVYARATTGTSSNSYQVLTKLNEFNYRDDLESREPTWEHASYLFAADLDGREAFNSLGIALYNSTNVPEAYASSVLFDNITITIYTADNSQGVVVFDGRGGNDPEPLVGPLDKAVGTLPVPYRYGYDFTGWKYDVTTGEGDNQVTTTYDFTEESVLTNACTFVYAAWKLSDGVVEIKFRSNVESYDANAPVLVAHPGQPIVGIPSEVPTAAGQTFLGWYYDRAFTKPLDPNCAPSENSTLFAKWENKGVTIDFEGDYGNYYSGKSPAYSSDRYSIKELENGNHVLYYDFSRGATVSNTTSLANAILYNDGKYFFAIDGMKYTLKFKYYVVENSAPTSAKIGAVISQKTGTWVNRHEQTGSVLVGEAEDQWYEGEVSFIAVSNAAATTQDDRAISIGISDNCKVYIDDLVVISPYYEMNMYGTAAILQVNGGEYLDPVSGDVGDDIVLPTPKKNGFVFRGWYLDSELTQPFTGGKYGEETLFLYAKWQLGKFSENFEDYPPSAKALGVAGAYSFYNQSSTGFDASNIHGGSYSLFRNGATAGVRAFTLMRSAELALTVGDTYTLTMWVKPTSIGDVNGTINLMEIGSFTGIASGKIADVVANVSNLTEGEWQQVSYTFTAQSEFYAIATGAGNDMYFDDITVTLKGYTGTSTGDSSISPIIILSMIVLSAAVIFFTCKKVYSK